MFYLYKAEDFINYIEIKLKMKTNKIITSYDFPPIPLRDYDWSAIRENYDEGDLIGYGKTEKEAISDLLEKEQEKPFEQQNGSY